MRNLILAIVLTMCGAAQAFQPNRPVQIIVPNPPGGNTDTIARVLAAKFEERVNQRILVVNRSGAQGSIAARAAITANTDGHTMHLTSTTFLFSHLLGIPGADYDPVNSLSFVGLVGTTPTKLFSRGNIQEDLPGIVKRLRAGHPYTLGVGNAATDFAAQLLARSVGHEINIIRYNNSLIYYADLVSGRIDLALNAGIDDTINESVRTGRIKHLATLDSKQRIKNSLDAHVPGVIHTSWYGLSLPPNTPREIVQYWVDNINWAINDPQTRSRLRAMHLEVPTMTGPAQFREQVAGDLARYQFLSRK